MTMKWQRRNSRRMAERDVGRGHMSQTLLIGEGAIAQAKAAATKTAIVIKANEKPPIAI